MYEDFAIVCSDKIRAQSEIFNDVSSQPLQRLCNALNSVDCPANLFHTCLRRITFLFLKLYLDGTETRPDQPPYKNNFNFGRSAAILWCPKMQMHIFITNSDFIKALSRIFFSGLIAPDYITSIPLSAPRMDRAPEAAKTNSARYGNMR